MTNFKLPSQLALFFMFCFALFGCSNLEDEKLEAFNSQVAGIKITAYDSIFSTTIKEQTLKIFPQFLNGADEEVFLEELPKQVIYINDKVSKDLVIDTSEEAEYSVFMKVGSVKSNTLRIKVMDVNTRTYISRIAISPGDSTFSPYAISGISRIDLKPRIYNYKEREFETDFYPNYSVWFDGVEYPNPTNILVNRTGNIPYYVVSGDKKSEVQYIISREKPDLSPVYSLPIIFHLVKGPGSREAYSEEIPGILEKANEQFRNEPSTFRQSHNSFDSGIQFTLALTDTLGNLLNEPGIHRINTDIDKFPYNSNLTNEFIFEHLWDPEKYINVFILELTGAGGFANFPREYPADQIPPLNFNYAVAVGMSSYRNSTTLTHELGHLFGLPHIFHNNEYDPCKDGDGIPDTESYLKKGDILASKQDIYCNDIPFYSTNYMDYIGAKNSFTLDQVIKMREVVSKNIYLPAIDSKGRIDQGSFVKGTLDLSIKAVQ
ncbi:M43 family zinc metalloprotease [Algoriphagus pacificus]|uniref:Peptidase M43 pregnancy-associated plasma-A domain-containing protein n=1 Tax=Algoriphagus pacificus TaxID=2811234 RepID=A0ABS3CJT4_9BACT|nr:M43 family zinc metalloprotease [Algoriphagus pacificus]MBN7817357.1 hypothetical protein [Algoriphagus pacificus]